jgi:signal transduction histidine kinase
MTIKSDKSQDVQICQDARRAAELIQQHKADILNQWLDITLSEVPGARDQGRAELADHLAILLHDITRILASMDADFSLEKIAQIEFGTSARHGRERATLKGYNVGHLAHEHIILRHIIIDFCTERELDDRRLLDVISRAIEFAALTAVNEFARSMQEIQQKLMATLIHDVRTPLGVAANYAKALSLPNISAEQKQAAVKTIDRSLGRVLSMLEELLDSVKLDAGRGLLMRFEQTDLNEAMRNTCTEASHIYVKKIVPVLEDHPVVGTFDEALIIRTLENLISNAVKFGYENTPINVSLDDMGDHVSIRVHNRGDPVPERQMEEIFAFFSNAPGHHGSVKGWGLGLSLIKTVAKNHGGGVILDSSEEEGTTVGMILFKHYRRQGEELSVLL